MSQERSRKQVRLRERTVSGDMFNQIFLANRMMENTPEMRERDKASEALNDAMEHHARGDCHSDVLNKAKSDFDAAVAAVIVKRNQMLGFEPKFGG